MYPRKINKSLMSSPFHAYLWAIGMENLDTGYGILKHRRLYEVLTLCSRKISCTIALVNQKMQERIAQLSQKVLMIMYLFSFPRIPKKLGRAPWRKRRTWWQWRGCWARGENTPATICWRSTKCWWSSRMSNRWASTEIHQKSATYSISKISRIRVYFSY